MKKKEYKFSVFALFVATILVWPSCTRDFDELDLAKFPSTPEVFIDEFSAGLNYAAFGGSKVTAFDVDNEVKYSGSSSMRIEVPDAGDPEGSYAGGVYFTDVGRDLTGYDALTFYAKASKPASIDLVGFGNDLGESKYLASIQGVAVNSNWKKYIIPIPDPSKLSEERGLFYYSEGPEDGVGYTIWFDEVRFEKLGTIAHKKAMILDGEDKTTSAVNGLSITLTGLSMSFNMPTGIDQIVYVAPAYFNFSSSDEGVASVDELGVVKVLGEGSSTITASSGDTEATGSLTVESLGEFTHAPVPDKDPGDVISVFSNAYTNVPVDFYNGYWEPYQTTLSADFTVDDDDVLYYTNFNFVGIQFTAPTIDATNMTNLHMDVWIPGDVDPADKLSIKIVDMGPDGSLDGNDPSISYEVPGPLSSNSWISVDVPLSSLGSRSKLAQIILENLGTGLSGFYLDNVYFYGGGSVAPTEPSEAAPTPPAREASDVISIYGDAYTNLAGTDYPDWGQATVVSDVSIQGNSTLKFAGLNYQGIQLAGSQDVSGMEFLHLDFWTANSTALNVYLISTGPVEKAYALTVPTTGWTSVDIPLSGFSPVDLADIIQFKFDGNGDIFLDNIYFYKTGGTATEPSSAAPAPPARDAGDVVSVFSGAYTDLSGTDFNPSWGQSTVVTTEDIAGNSTLKYATFNYQGTAFAASQDLSGMEYLHIDMWTADATVVKVSPINGSGSPTENLVSLTPINAGQWNSYDIPLTDFTANGMSLDDVIQMKFDGQEGTTPSTIYLDNIYFYRTGGAATEPAAAAPTPPARDAADVISLFSDAYSNVTVNTWRTDWSSATLEDVSIAGNAAKKYSALDFVGIETNPNTVDASGMTYVHLDVWSADITRFSIKLVDFGADGAFGGGDDVEHQLDFDSPAQGQWVSYDLALSDFTNLTTTGHIGQYILVGQPTGATTIWIDNFYFYKTGGAATEPAAAAPTPPARDAADVISLFSDAYADVTVNTWRTDWSSATLEDVSIAGNAAKKYSALDFVGIETNPNTVDASGMTRIHLDVWSADITRFSIKLVDFGADGVFGGGDDVEHQLDFDSPSQGQWVSYDLALSDFTNLTTTGHIAQYILVGQPTGATTIWIDNFYFYNDGGGTGGSDPTVPATTPPARNAADVISFFSNAYTNVTVDSWSAEWDDSDVADLQVAGDDVKKYTFTNFAGIDFSNHKLDASGMTNFHMDIWTPDNIVPGDVLTIKCVDFGGGSVEASNFILTVVHTPNGAIPALETGTWVSIDVPVSAFAGTTTRSDLAQIVLTCNLSTLYIDNLYFYK